VRQTYATVDAFYCEAHPHFGEKIQTEAEKDAEQKRFMLLPEWLTTSFTSFLSKVHMGGFDKTLQGHLASPPRGGIAVLTFAEHLVGPGADSPLKTAWQVVEKDYLAWSQQATGANETTGEGPKGNLGNDEGIGGGADPLAADGAGDCEEEEPTPAMRAAALKAELLREAMQMRKSYVATLNAPDTTAAALRAIEGSAVARKDGVPRKRLAFLYTLAQAYDQPRPDKAVGGDKRSTTTPSLWPEDFEAYCRLCHAYITPENQGYAIVFLGRTKRHGAGLAAQAGLTIESSVIDTFRKLEQEDRTAGQFVKANEWQTKAVTVLLGAQRCLLRGISGHVVESVLVLFRGAWPFSIKPVSRTDLTGSTWDDF